MSEAHYVTPEEFDITVDNNNMFIVSIGFMDDQLKTAEKIIKYIKPFNNKDPTFIYTCVYVDYEVIKHKIIKPEIWQILKTCVYYKRKFNKTKLIIWKFAYTDVEVFVYVQTYLESEFSYSNKMLDGNAGKCPFNV